MRSLVVAIRNMYRLIRTSGNVSRRLSGNIDVIERELVDSERDDDDDDVIGANFNAASNMTNSYPIFTWVALFFVATCALALCAFRPRVRSSVFHWMSRGGGGRRRRSPRFYFFSSWLNKFK